MSTPKIFDPNANLLLFFFCNIMMMTIMMIKKIEEKIQKIYQRMLLYCQLDMSLFLNYADLIIICIVIIYNSHLRDYDKIFISK